MLSKFRSDTSGGLPSVEFAMLSPVLVILSFLMIQFLLMAQAMVVVKSAAHAAARSALVHYCSPIALENLSTSLKGSLACNENTKPPIVAAKLALMPIAPSNDNSRNREPCQFPEALIKLMTHDAVRPELIPSIENKACYVFEKDIVTVEVDWKETIGGVQITKGPPPMEAKVTVKLPLLAPVRMIFEEGKHKDDTKFWIAEATVVIL